jgi:hypothetical protein
MAKRTFNYYLIKIVRISGWVLLPVVLLYIGTGLTMRGDFGHVGSIWMDRVRRYHPALAWPFIAVFLVHTIAAIYLAMRRWGWIGKRKKA